MAVVLAISTAFTVGKVEGERPHLETFGCVSPARAVSQSAPSASETAKVSV